MRVAAAVVVVGACGPPQYDMDLIVRPDDVGLSARPVECKPRYAPLAPGECRTQFFLEGDVQPKECWDDCMLQVMRGSDELVISGCDAEARARIPQRYPAAPVVTVQTIDTEQVVLEVRVEAPLTGFKYAFYCGSDVTTCASSTAVETARASCRTSIHVWGDELVETRDTELGVLRLWARGSTDVTP